MKSNDQKLSLNSKKISDLAQFMVENPEAIAGGNLNGCHPNPPVIIIKDTPPPSCDRLSGNCGAMSGW